MIRRRIGRPVTVGDVTFVPLFRVSVQGGAGRSGLWTRAAAGLEGVAVFSARGVVVFDSEGREIPTEPSLERFEGLQGLAEQHLRPDRGGHFSNS